MASSLVVPVIDVQNDNFKELWPAMVVAIKTASFVALDTELSGLGNRKALLAESIEDRYKAICHAARSRSILSLGIACYKKLDQKPADTYLVQVYNLTLLCSEEYIIEPQSVHFLVQHGFDFNKQYSRGIPYCKGNNKGGADDRGVHIRALFTELLRARKPLVLHNGLIDMAFLYQSFYAHLPERLATFTADLSEMFPAGIYDTKYITEFELRLSASYLEYAYKKCKLDNGRSVDSRTTGAHVHMEFCQYAGQMSTYVDYRDCPAVASTEEQTDICQRFSAFGWCPNGTQCPLSHDTDRIILHDEKNKEDKRKKRKRQREKKKCGGEGPSIFDGAPKNKISNMEVDPEDAPGAQQGTPAEMCPDSVSAVDSDGNAPQNEGKNLETHSKENSVCDDSTHSSNLATTGTIDDGANTKSVESESGAGRETFDEHSAWIDAQKKNADAGTHRAGFDAFMTGYIFAYSCTFIRKEEAEEVDKEQKQEDPSWVPTCLNKIYLSGKAVPLNVVKSTFSKSSKAHVQKMEMLRVEPSPEPAVGLLPRLCHMVKGEQGYGFNLHSDKKKRGQFVRAVDPDSPAERSGIRHGDRILEVNGVTTEGLRHSEVVGLIRAAGDKVHFLVVDQETDELFIRLGIIPTISHLKEVCVDGPAPDGEPPTPSPTTQLPASDPPIINSTMTNSLITKLSPKSWTNGSSASQSSRSSTTQSEISSSDMSFQVPDEDDRHISDPFVDSGLRLSPTAAEAKQKVLASRNRKRAPPMDWSKKQEIFSNF